MTAPQSFGTCGHALAGAATPVAVKSRTREGVRAIAYPVLCDKCRAEANRARLILRTDYERAKWIEQGGNGAHW